MDIEQAIRSRRTHKAFGPKPVERKTLDELFELARWAPNHHGTNPWRFRVLGPGALTKGFERAFMVGAGFAIAGALLALLLISSRDSREHATAARAQLAAAQARG